MSKSDFKFLGYRVYKVEFAVNDLYKPNEEEKELKQDIKIKSNFSEEMPRFVEVDMCVTVSTDDESVKFVIGLKGAFEASLEMEQELFMKLAKSNAPAILYPFIRALVASYTAQGNIAPIILPTINFAATESAITKN